MYESEHFSPHFIRSVKLNLSIQIHKFTITIIRLNIHTFAILSFKINLLDF